jgi:hypothetical protein
VINVDKYLDSIINEVRRNSSDKFNESVMMSAVTTAAGKSVTNQIKYPIDSDAKKIIVKKVKLEMKIKKFKEKYPEYKDMIVSMKKELDEVNGFYKSMISAAKTDKVRDIINEYENKCRVDYGPRSVYFATIKPPAVAKESKRDEIMESSISDFILENGTTILSNIANLVVEDSDDDNDEYLSSDDTDLNEPSNSNIKSETSEPTIDENFIANMLPQTGSTEGLGDPESVIKDVKTLDDSIEDKTQTDPDNYEGIELPDDVEIESVLDYINNDEIEYNYTTEDVIRSLAAKVKTRIVLPAKIKKVALDKAIIKNKIKFKSKFNLDEKTLAELKRSLIEKEKKLRELQKELTNDEVKELNAFIKTTEKELNDKNREKNEKKDKEKIKKIGKDFAEYEKNKDEKKEDNKSTSKTDKTALESMISELDELRDGNNDLTPELQIISLYESKLDEAMNDNNIDAIVAYTNKIRYIKNHINDVAQEMVATESINEAANIDNDMKPIIEVLNQKGYKTKYSSAGHHGLRKKEDDKRDGVYYNKLYSDARIQFDQDYDFPPAPKYWCWKEVNGSKDYLDIIPEPYRDSDGTPNEAFTKWKGKYMSTLKTWVDNLPDKNKSDSEVVTADRKGRMQVQESLEEMYDDMMSSINMNYFND